MGSIKAECLDRIVFFGERTLQSATTSFLEHYHIQRNHQGLANGLIAPGEEVPADGPGREVLGGVRNDAGPSRGEGGAVAAALSELESASREVHGFDQGRVSGSDGLLRGENPAISHNFVP